jgi:hypothetical protein
MPPECPCCVHEPAGAAPRPASRTPHDAPFKWTRSVQCKAVIECGDKVVPSPRGEVYARLRAGWGLRRAIHPTRRAKRRYSLPVKGRDGVCGSPQARVAAPLPGIVDVERYQETRMPALPPMPSMSSPKVTSTLANTLVEAVGLKKFTPPETSPHTSWRWSSRMKVVPVETSVA